MKLTRKQPPAEAPFDRVTKPLAADLRAFYEAESARVQRLVARARTDFQRWRLDEILAQLRAEKDRLDAYAMQWATRATSESFRAGVEFVVPDTARITGTFNQVHRGAIEALTAQIQADLLTANERMAGNVERIIRLTRQTVVADAAISEAIRSGVAIGEARRDTSMRLLGLLTGDYDEGRLIPVVCRDGVTRRYEAGYYAELVARTRTREAASAGIANQAQALGMDLVQISDHNTPTPICQRYEGKIFSLSGSNPDFPRLDRFPPFHPNCKHVMNAVSETYLRVRGIYNRMSLLSQPSPGALLAA